MKVLLISLNQQDVEDFKKAPTDISALGVRYLSSYLRSRGREVKILFLAKPYGGLEGEDELRQIENFIAELNPDLVGISLMSNHFFRARLISANIKNKFPNLPLIWGGIHPTIAPENCLQHVDLICIGEGEIPLEQLTEGDNLKQYQFDIPGIWYKKDGQIIKTGPAPLIKDIDCLPFPDYDFSQHFIIHQGQLIPLTVEIFRQYYPAARGDHRLLSSRGCPHACAYCCNSVFRELYGGGFLRQRSARNFIAEMKAVKEKFDFIQSFKIMDDSFTVNDIKWLEEFSAQYKQEINLPFLCLASPLTISQEKIDALAAAGLTTVQLGLQSGSDRINREVYGRHVSSSQFLSAVRILEKHRGRLNLIIDVIVDNPYEQEEDLLYTINILNQIKRPFHVSMFSLAFYPGTALYRRANQDNVLADRQEYLSKQFHFLKKNILNKLIYLIPHLSTGKIDDLVSNRASFSSRIYIELMYFVIRHKSNLPPAINKFLSRLKKILKNQ
jgi:radical SAM superfamily enzyme YgiQ (UPF0313 family)